MPARTNQAALMETEESPTGARKEAVRAFVTGLSIEVTPAATAKIADLREILRPGTAVYVTFLAGANFADTIATAKRLRREGFNPVPHLAARGLPDRAFLDETLRIMRGEADVTEVLCIAGQIKNPVGEFGDSMQVLATGLFDKHGIRRIGVAGHPEGSPDIPDAEIARALRWKNEFAERTGADLYILTQFCFEAAPVIAWDKALRAADNRLPIRVGLPGIATIKTLLGYARACGIGPSMTFLTKQARNIGKLMSLSAPDRLIADLAAYATDDPACGIVGCHMFPLGGLRKTAAWGYAVADGNFVLDPTGGFALTADIG